MGSKSSGGLLGRVGEVFTGDAGAAAAGRAAMAQQQMAQRAFGEIAPGVKEATVSGLASFDQALKQQERNIARQEALVAQIDPTILEASQQALKLLRGENAQTLAPLQRQRETQRLKLLNSLREQLGPGAETSTMGQQALSRFDTETSNLLSGAQQQALGTVSNIFGQFSSQKPQMGQEIGAFGNLAQGRAGIQFSGAQALQGAYNPMMQTAGAQYTADVLRGQQRAAFGNTLLGGLATGLASGMGAGLFGGAAGAAGAAAGGAASAGVSDGVMGGFGQKMFAGP